LQSLTNQSASPFYSLAEWKKGKGIGCPDLQLGLWSFRSFIPKMSGNIWRIVSLVILFTWEMDGVRGDISPAMLDNFNRELLRSAVMPADTFFGNKDTVVQPTAGVHQMAGQGGKGTIGWFWVYLALLLSGNKITGEIITQ
jgi:hypothetical protein